MNLSRAVHLSGRLLLSSVRQALHLHHPRLDGRPLTRVGHVVDTKFLERRTFVRAWGMRCDLRTSYTLDSRLPRRCCCCCCWMLLVRRPSPLGLASPRVCSWSCIEATTQPPVVCITLDTGYRLQLIGGSNSITDIIVCICLNMIYEYV